MRGHVADQHHDGSHCGEPCRGEEEGRAKLDLPLSPTKNTSVRLTHGRSGS